MSVTEHAGFFLETQRVWQVIHMHLHTAHPENAHETTGKKRKQANSQLLTKWSKLENGETTEK